MMMWVALVVEMLSSLVSGQPRTTGYSLVLSERMSPGRTSLPEKKTAVSKASMGKSDLGLGIDQRVGVGQPSQQGGHQRCATHRDGEDKIELQNVRIVERTRRQKAHWPAQFRAFLKVEGRVRLCVATNDARKTPAPPPKALVTPWGLMTGGYLCTRC